MGYLLPWCLSEECCNSRCRCGSFVKWVLVEHTAQLRWPRGSLCPLRCQYAAHMMWRTVQHGLPLLVPAFAGQGPLSAAPASTRAPASTGLLPAHAHGLQIAAGISMHSCCFADVTVCQSVAWCACRSVLMMCLGAHPLGGHGLGLRLEFLDLPLRLSASVYLRMREV